MKRAALLILLACSSPVHLYDGHYILDCWGDSLTAGSPGPPAESYPAVIEDRYGANFQTYNYGVPGETSTQVAARVTPADSSSIGVFWVGRNNFADYDAVLRDVNQMRQRYKRFVIISILNGDTEPAGTEAYRQIARLNFWLSLSYPHNFLDVRRSLAHGTPDNVPNAKWRADNVHLNREGYAEVARLVTDFVRSRRELQ